MPRIWKGVCRNTLKNGMIVNRMFNFTPPHISNVVYGSSNGEGLHNVGLTGNYSNAKGGAHSL